MCSKLKLRQSSMISIKKNVPKILMKESILAINSFLKFNKTHIPLSLIDGFNDYEL